jgi:hypothetical protein
MHKKSTHFSSMSWDRAVRQSNQINGFLIFVMICFLAVTIAFAGNYVLISDDLLFDFFDDQLAYERIIELIEQGKEWRWIGYAILPLYLLIKFLLVACCLTVGALLAGFNITFKELFRTCMIAELVFFIPSFIKLVWFGLFFTDYTLQDLQFFAPLSLINLIGRENVDVWLIYPLQLINVFELCYWFALAYILTRIAASNFSKMLGLVASSYGISLLLWVTFVIFITVSISA